MVGKKIGLTSRANQEVFGVHEPVCGQLMGQGVYLEATPVDTASLIQPIIEMRNHLCDEPAYRGARGVRCRRCCAARRASCRRWNSGIRACVTGSAGAKVADILADSCGTAGIIVGGELHSVRNFDMRYTGMVVEKNGDIIATGAAGAVMGNPAQSVAWLANKLAEFDLAIEEGDMVLAGALTGAVRMASAMC